MLYIYRNTIHKEKIVFLLYIEIHINSGQNKEKERVSIEKWLYKASGQSTKKEEVLIYRNTIWKSVYFLYIKKKHCFSYIGKYTNSGQNLRKRRRYIYEKYHLRYIREIPIYRNTISPGQNIKEKKSVFNAYI